MVSTSSLGTAHGDATPVFRDDGEMVGLLILDGDLWAPSTVFGFRLGEPRPNVDAVEFLLGEGLSSLADPWELNEDGEWLNVQIVEANTANVTVSFADYGHPDLFGTRRTLDAPVGEMLRRA
jgi:hypothetical protein